MDAGCDDVPGAPKCSGDTSTPELLPPPEVSEVSDALIEGDEGLSLSSGLFEVLVAFRYIGCGNVPGVPGVPGLPGVPGVPGFLNCIPDEFGVPGVSCLSGVPKVIDVSVYVRCNGVPIMPGMSDVLDLPG